MSAQVTERVPPEVWLVIFQHARLPIPPALSHPKRSELRQQTLTVLARTCKLFNALVIPLLYKTVITDDFRAFFNVKRDPHRRPLLSLCESLFIEYQDGDTPYPYEYLLKFGGHYSWSHFAPNEAEAEEFRMERCADEMVNIEIALHWLYDGGLNGILPRLERVSVGSVYGHQGDLWARGEQHDLWLQEEYNREEGEKFPVESRIAECARMWESLIERSNVSHICVRDPSGPLGFSLEGEEPGCPPRVRRTIHFGPDTRGLGIHVGQNATWVSDIAQDQAWEPMYDAVLKAVTMFVWAWQLRVNDAPAVNGPSRHTVQVDVYGSTSDVGAFVPSNTVLPLRCFTVGIPGGDAAILSVDAQRAIARAIGVKFSVRMSKSQADVVTDRDKARWYPSHDYPGCKSCGFGPPL